MFCDPHVFGWSFFFGKLGFPTSTWHQEPYLMLQPQRGGMFPTSDSMKIPPFKRLVIFQGTTPTKTQETYLGDVWNLKLISSQNFGVNSVFFKQRIFEKPTLPLCTLLLNRSTLNSLNISKQINCYGVVFGNTRSCEN